MTAFISTTSGKVATFKEALFSGLAEDGGLYMPEMIDPLPAAFFEAMPSMNFQEIAYQVASHLLKGAISDDALQEIVKESFNFPVPLVTVEENIYSLELFHGPTLSFKDFGARFMARSFEKLLPQDGKTLNILVATSGDTGSAAAHGFYQLPGIKVWILYPKGKVSKIQEQQMTTLNHNIEALEVAGNFDDCQRLVKQAFQDRALKEKLTLTSANSINIGRLIPQSFYYFFAASRLKKSGQPLVFSVPSGNFGNLTGGLIAKKMGLPVERFIAATNSNDVVPHYLESGIFLPKPSKKTLSNAMDVGNPSNFARMVELYNHDLQAMRRDIFGASFDDSKTLQAMREVKKEHGYFLDPHGAVAYLGLKRYLKEEAPSCGIFLETAHPAKFLNCLPEKVPLPQRLQECLHQEKRATPLEASYDALKSLLLSFN